MPSFSTLFAITSFLPITYGDSECSCRHAISIESGGPDCVHYKFAIDSPAGVRSNYRALFRIRRSSRSRCLRLAHYSPVAYAHPNSHRYNYSNPVANTPAPLPTTVLAPPTPPPITTSVSAPGATSSSVPLSSSGALIPTETLARGGSAPSASGGSGSTSTQSPSATSVPAEASPSSAGTANPNGEGGSTQTQSPSATSVPASTGSLPNPNGGSSSTPTQSPLAIPVPPGASPSSGGAANPNGSGSTLTRSPSATSVTGSTGSLATSIPSVAPHAHLGHEAFGPPTASPVSTPRSTLNATRMYTSTAKTVPPTPPPSATLVPGAPVTSGGADGGCRPARWMALIAFGAATAVLVHCL
ncbi:hypothetical protein K438DRAFT_1780679 [Mycena galopus ATCC 62051]|nr:hypothetical protein K438DRAFT_1780679 [Mycena galopus ATCC 62051]